MKNIFKFLMIAMVVLAGASCEDSDLIIDEVLDSVDTESGAVVRTVGDLPDLVTLSNPDNNFIEMTLEVQQGNGSFVPDFNEIRVFVQMWEDQDLTTPTSDGNGNPLSEQFITSFAESEFSIDANALPRGTFTIPTQTILDAFPADANITVPTFLAIRLELEMADGTVFTNTSVGGQVSGGIYFNAPFFYRVIFINS
ncbi:hypothetical protein POV27_16145 [Aureisphaera galaxeae]|uniref:hypothetical protein n=1 Tax=Aureisphaera galaxeae TaxID=1538023 RepID=UPI0023504AE6|nr:hypothetical protein [Aureisphaera galaxeae]MDC8005591.1 hypothetical protein [Aureisphaera galaxeae]